jgi:hypothetical protein
MPGRGRVTRSRRPAGPAKVADGAASGIRLVWRETARRRMIPVGNEAAATQSPGATAQYWQGGEFDGARSRQMVRLHPSPS